MKRLIVSFSFILLFSMACTNNPKPTAQKEAAPVKVEAVAPNLPPPDSLNMKHDDDDEKED